MAPSECLHEEVVCLNQYELIRKYRCATCGGVMMCACDAERGTTFLSHQLRHGVELATQVRVPVALGFRPDVCRECRGLPPVAAPKASIYGHTSKIKRYYWREIKFREFQLLADAGISPRDFNRRSTPEAAAIRATALEQIKQQHERSPKYFFDSESEAAFLSRLNVVVEEIEANALTHGKIGRADGTSEGPEAFAMGILAKRGYKSMQCESRPLHVLFAALLWKLIQDPRDPHVREVAFGERRSFEQVGRSTEMIVTTLPNDFGTSGYGARSASAIEAFFAAELPVTRDGLLSAFDSGLESSVGLRQYLWAHRAGDISRSRQILEIVRPSIVRKWLRHLLNDYWEHYIGWPDLLAWRDEEVFFAEIKLGSDKLSDEQRRWIEHNSDQGWCPFMLIKIRKA